MRLPISLLAGSFLSNHLISGRLQKETLLYSSILKVQRFFTETKLIRFLDAPRLHVSDQQKSSSKFQHRSRGKGQVVFLRPTACTMWIGQLGTGYL